MHGVYSWNAGASSSAVVGDLLRWINGGDIAGMSASCNKLSSSVTGAGAGDWQIIDSGYGVIRHAGILAGPGVTARLSVSGALKVQLAVVDGWDSGTHTATHATTAADASLALSSAGSVNLIAGASFLLVGASDWSVWSLACEVKRDGPAMAGAPTKSGAMTLNYSTSHYMARCKTPGSAGETTNATMTVQSAYGALSAAAARDQSERLYLPMAPATASYSSVPVEEISGIKIVGGYALSGDSVVDDLESVFTVVKAGAIGFAVLRA